MSLNLFIFFYYWRYHCWWINQLNIFYKSFDIVAQRGEKKHLFFASISLTTSFSSNWGNWIDFCLNKNFFASQVNVELKSAITKKIYFDNDLQLCYLGKQRSMNIFLRNFFEMNENSFSFPLKDFKCPIKRVSWEVSSFNLILLWKTQLFAGILRA